MKIQSFFDKATFTMTYIVFDENSKDAVIIDPVYDFDPHSGKLSQESFELASSFIKDHGLNLHYILETHVHADHLSGSQLFKEMNPQVKIAIHENIKLVQEVFEPIFNLKGENNCDGSQFDELVKDGDLIKAGSLEIKVIATPGHTPACVSYLVEDAVFTGDALFMPDMGTGRCDFPKGDAEKLYDSLMKIYELPESTRIFVGHDYGPGGREIAWQTTVKEQREGNIQLKANTTKEEFVTFRKNRDAQLNAPKLLLPSIQVNMRAGNLPESEENGSRYIKIPLS
jgi:glyoxylase-like metal-dependent hydrolase (beta-lactamase superfamily II)